MLEGTTEVSVLLESEYWKVRPDLDSPGVLPLSMAMQHCTRVQCTHNSLCVSIHVGPPPHRTLHSTRLTACSSWGMTDSVQCAHICGGASAAYWMCPLVYVVPGALVPQAVHTSMLRH